MGCGLQLSAARLGKGKQPSIRIALDEIALSTASWISFQISVVFPAPSQKTRIENAFFCRIFYKTTSITNRKLESRAATCPPRLHPPDFRNMYKLVAALLLASASAFAPVHRPRALAPLAAKKVSCVPIRTSRCRTSRCQCIPRLSSFPELRQQKGGPAPTTPRPPRACL